MPLSFAVTFAVLRTRLDLARCLPNVDVIYCNCQPPSMPTASAFKGEEVFFMNVKNLHFLRQSLLRSRTLSYTFLKKSRFLQIECFFAKIYSFQRSAPKKCYKAAPNSAFGVRIDRHENSDAICCRNASVSPIVDIYSFNCHSLKLEIFCRQMSTFFKVACHDKKSNLQKIVSGMPLSISWLDTAWNFSFFSGMPLYF